MLIVGLTGGIATGKSTVSKRFKEHYNFPVVDADVIAREVVEVDTPGYKAIVSYFEGITPDLLNEDKTLNRAALGRTIFGNDVHRKVLNSIVHPAVRRAMAWGVIKAWLTGQPIVVLDVPLLFESKLDKYTGTTIVISTNDELQFERLRARDPHLTEQESRHRVESQMPMAKKESLADHVVDNNGTLEQLYANLDKVVEEIKPNSLVTLLEWFPPFGLVMALVTYLRK